MKSSTVSFIITFIIGCLGLGAGLIIGYLLRVVPEQSARRAGFTSLEMMKSADNESELDVMGQCRKAVEHDPVIRDYLLSSEVEACHAASCQVDLPRVYVVYKLDKGHIDIDGKLDERAWRDVAWTEPFVDIRGEDLPAPRFETRVKLRWDDRNLYVGAHIQEFAVWANKTLHDSTIYQDNSFQVLLDTAQSNHKYKEISINALGTVSDIMLTRPYMDDGEPLVFWESDVVRAVHIEGPVNNPARRNKFWSVEMALPFKQLFAGLGRDSDLPSDRETWRANFVRSEWQTEIAGSKYLKRLDAEADWWAWQSPGVANIHLPDKWGLLQFRDVPINSTRFQPDRSWVTTNALLDVYRAQKVGFHPNEEKHEEMEAEMPGPVKFQTEKYGLETLAVLVQAYKAVTGRYAEKKEHLRLPPYVLSKRCIRDLDIQLDWGGFRVTARPAEEFLEDGHTRTDRFVWFGDQKEDFFR